MVANDLQTPLPFPSPCAHVFTLNNLAPNLTSFMFASLWYLEGVQLPHLMLQALAIFSRLFFFSPLVTPISFFSAVRFEKLSTPSIAPYAIQMESREA